MAILKHMSIKNNNYNDAFDYLTMQHDEFTMKPILDENGSRIPREEYLIEGINCNPFSYASECEALNASFRKNTDYDEIKAHHYIISFDPKDKDENSLTMEKAQSLGMEFAKKNFPGHQIIVCTHPDGHSSSGNLHVHIVFNSLRKETVDRTSFMERKHDNIAGYKHNLTNKYLRYLKQEVMSMCQDNSLYQVDLLNPAKEKITDTEYWQSKRGQLLLDKKNASKKALGIPVTKTVYETKKAILRKLIKDTIKDSSTLKEFEQTLLSRYGVEVHYSRGKISFLMPDEKRSTRGRQLGTIFEKEAIEKAILTKNVSTPRISFVVDLENNLKAKENAFYERKVKISNLKEMAKAVAFVQDNNIASLEELESLVSSTKADYDNTLSSLKSTEDALKKINLQIKYTGQYLANKDIYKEYLNTPNKADFRENHRSEIALYEAARKYLNEESNDKKLPSMKALKEEKSRLTLLKNEQYESYSSLKTRHRNLQAVYHNVAITLDKDPLDKGIQKTKSI